MTETGQTADFLRGQKKGDDLITSLTSETPPEAPARAHEVTQEPAVVAQEKTVKAVVEGLTAASPEPEVRSREVQSDVEKRPEVDHSMIDDLIDGPAASDEPDESRE